VEIPIHPDFVAQDKEESDQEKSSGKSWVIAKQKLGDRLGKTGLEILELVFSSRQYQLSK
jgi:hypothetical protein